MFRQKGLVAGEDGEWKRLRIAASSSH
jgi:hypothetical protein